MNVIWVPLLPEADCWWKILKISSAIHPHFLGSWLSFTVHNNVPGNLARGKPPPQAGFKQNIYGVLQKSSPTPFLTRYWSSLDNSKGNLLVTQNSSITTTVRPSNQRKGYSHLLPNQEKAKSMLVTCFQNLSQKMYGTRWLNKIPKNHTSSNIIEVLHNRLPPANIFIPLFTK